MGEVNVVLVNSTGVDIRPYERAIVASLREVGTLPEELADLFSVTTLRGCNADGSDRFVLFPAGGPERYVAATVDTAVGVRKIATLTNDELRHHARVAWDTNDGDTLRGCRLEARARGIEVA